MKNTRFLFTRCGGYGCEKMREEKGVGLLPMPFFVREITGKLAPNRAKMMDNEGKRT